MADIPLEDLKQRLRAQRQPTGASQAELRAALDSASARAKMDPRVQVTDISIGTLSAEWLKPEGAKPDAVLLYIHGGAFVGGSCASHRPLASVLALETCRNTLTLNYRLAPEHPWPAAEEDVLAAYRQLLSETDNIAIAGDSAGGNLAMRLLLRARDENLHMPRAAALMSPWIDLDLNSGSIIGLSEDDPTLDGARLRNYAAMYRGGSAGPQILGERLEHLSPILIQAGGSEILRDDAIRLRRELLQAGVSAGLEIWPGAFHVWHAYFPWLAIARQAIGQIGCFLKH